MPIDMPEPVSRYFELDAQRDIDGIVALFADDAVVTDEGESRHGIAEIRTWQLGPASAYTYRTEVRDTEQLGPDRFLATGRLTGNFPGGTADLTWNFTIAADKISRLVIAPPPAQ
jgi:ketosteroid isomerase-like protein